MNGDVPAVVKNHRDLIEMLETRDRVIALFYASWCPFCIKFLPIFNKHAEKERRHFVRVQDDHDTMGDPYSVKIVPTVIFFENGVVSKRLDGLSGVGLDEKKLVEFIGLCPTSTDTT